MKQTALVLIISFISLWLHAQKLDESYPFVESGFVFKRYAYNGTDVVNTDFNSGPKYLVQKSSFFTISLPAIGGWHKPLFQNKNMSFGFNVGGGINLEYVLNFRDQTGGYVFSFILPEYLYLSKFIGKTPVTFFGGYKYSGGLFNAHQKILGLQFKVGNELFLNLSTSIFPPKYYIIYSDGTLKPALRLSEYNISIMTRW